MSHTDPVLRLQPLRFRVVAAAIIAAGVITPAPIWSCGLCITPGGLRIVHPKSLDVAVAIRRDLDSGLLKQSSALPHEKADRHFRDLQTGRMLAERLILRDGFELLLIEDGARYRIENTRAVRDRNRIAPLPVRWVTGRAVLQALLGRQLEFETAVKRGLVVVERTSTGPVLKEPRP